MVAGGGSGSGIKRSWLPARVASGSGVTALGGAWKHPAVSAVFPGVKAIAQLESNLAAADLDLVSEAHPLSAADPQRAGDRPAGSVSDDEAGVALAAGNGDTLPPSIATPPRDGGPSGAACLIAARGGGRCDPGLGHTSRPP